MHSPESCRAQMAECKNLLFSAESQAERTVLNLLVRNWRNIAGQTERYIELAWISTERTWPNNWMARITGGGAGRGRSTRAL
jgi:hypothetical protein